MEYSEKKLTVECAPAMLKATIREEVQEAKCAAVDILAMSRDIKGALIGASKCDEADKRTPQCCQDELAEINRILQMVICELQQISVGIGML